MSFGIVTWPRSPILIFSSMNFRSYPVKPPGCSLCIGGGSRAWNRPCRPSSWLSPQPEFQILGLVTDQCPNLDECRSAPLQTPTAQRGNADVQQLGNLFLRH